MIILGRRNRSATAYEGLVGSAWILAGFALASVAAVIVGGVPGMSGSPPPVFDTFDLGCKAQETVGQVLAGFVAQVAQGAADLILTTAAWWAGADSVDPRDAAVLAAQQATARWPWGCWSAVCSCRWSG